MQTTDSLCGSYATASTSHVLEANAYGQLAIDYCEYKFLSMRPLIDSLQLKANALLELNRHPKLSLQLQFDTINCLFSQSSLVTLKHLVNEWSVSHERHQKLPHFYRIFNRTNMPLNLKQFDTEETCPVRVGAHVPYTWRTHKKPQLMQLFIPKYFVSSHAFKLNRNGYQEIKLSYTHTKECFMACLVNVVPSTSSIHEKDVYFEAKLIVCNYLNNELQSFSLRYQCGNKEYELGTTPIGKNSRSDASYELVQLEDECEAILNVNEVKMNGNGEVVVDLKNYEGYTDLYNKLKKG